MYINLPNGYTLSFFKDMEDEMAYVMLINPNQNIITERKLTIKELDKLHGLILSIEY